MVNSLRDSLSKWTDVDVAEHNIATSLGIVPIDVFPKATYWSNNPVGNALYKILESLTEANILLRRDEPDIQFRWNDAFSGDWEQPKRPSN